MRPPYFISDPAQEVIAFAGLWSVWERPGASPIISCALLSAMIANCEQHFEGYRVSTKVNNVRNDSEELLERVAAP